MIEISERNLRKSAFTKVIIHPFFLGLVRDTCVPIFESFYLLTVSNTRRSYCLVYLSFSCFAKWEISNPQLEENKKKNMEMMGDTYIEFMRSYCSRCNARALDDCCILRGGNLTNS